MGYNNNWRIKLLHNPYVEFVPLTSDDQLELDPTGKAREFLQKLTSSDGSRRTPQSPDTLRYAPEKWLAWHDEFVMLNRTDRHHPLWDFNDECRAKWGGQGGTPSFSAIYDSLVEMFERAHHPRSFDVTIVGLRYLMSRILDAVEHYGVPQPVNVTRYRTNAALPTMGKKSDYHSETISMSPHRHVAPDLLGTRFQFQKSRMINQDAIGNVRLVEEFLARVRQWLRKYLPDIFGSWLNPVCVGGVAERITEAVDRGDINIEGDYHHMDAGFGRQCGELILPIFEVLLDPGEFQILAAYCEEVWKQPIYFGDFLLCGEHDLLSGVPITQDFETYFSAALHLGADCIVGQKRRVSLFIGDDSLLTYPRRYEREAEDVVTLIHEESARTGCIMHPDKTRFNTGDMRYCKRVYYAGGPRVQVEGRSLLLGAYPPIRTLNTIVLPERSVVPSQLVSAQLSRMDNLFGTPCWHQFVDGVYKRVSWDLPPLETLESDVYVDWWDRVYGERWSPLSSRTYKYLASR